MPECNIGASVQAAASNQETGECRSHRSVIMASSLSPPLTLPNPNLSVCLFLCFLLSCLHYALLQLVSGSWACLSCSSFVLLHLVHSGPRSYPVMTVQFLCATKKSFLMIVLRLFDLLLSSKDLLDMWEDIEDSCDSMVKKETFFNTGFDISCSCSTHVQRLNFLY